MPQAAEYEAAQRVDAFGRPVDEHGEVLSYELETVDLRVEKTVVWLRTDDEYEKQKYGIEHWAESDYRGVLSSINEAFGWFAMPQSLNKKFPLSMVERVQLSVPLHLYLYIYLYVYKHTYRYICIYLYIYTHTHISIYVYELEQEVSAFDGRARPAIGAAAVGALPP